MRLTQMWKLGRAIGVVGQRMQLGHTEGVPLPQAPRAFYVMGGALKLVMGGTVLTYGTYNKHSVIYNMEDPDQASAELRQALDEKKAEIQARREQRKQEKQTQKQTKKDANDSDGDVQEESNPSFEQEVPS